MEKDAAILDALEYLLQQFGAGSLEIVDHWEADRTAVGIENSEHPDRLVYISYANRARPTYSSFLECPSRVDNAIPFEHCGSFSQIGLDKLATIVSNHLLAEPLAM